jgi:hypothetical protein
MLVRISILNPDKMVALQNHWKKIGELVAKANSWHSRRFLVIFSSLAGLIHFCPTKRQDGA